MKTTIHTEPNEVPADMLEHGNHYATWQGWYVRLSSGALRVPTLVQFPGTVECVVHVTPDMITIVIELEAS